jgi:hypothetical protein
MDRIKCFWRDPVDLFRRKTGCDNGTESGLMQKDHMELVSGDFFPVTSIVQTFDEDLLPGSKQPLPGADSHDLAVDI